MNYCQIDLLFAAEEHHELVRCGDFGRPPLTDNTQEIREAYHAALRRRYLKAAGHILEEECEIVAREIARMIEAGSWQSTAPPAHSGPSPQTPHPSSEELAWDLGLLNSSTTHDRQEGIGRPHPMTFIGNSVTGVKDTMPWTETAMGGSFNATLFTDETLGCGGDIGDDWIQAELQLPRASADLDPSPWSQAGETEMNLIIDHGNKGGRDSVIGESPAPSHNKVQQPEFHSDNPVAKGPIGNAVPPRSWQSRRWNFADLHRIAK